MSEAHWQPCDEEQPPPTNFYLCLSTMSEFAHMFFRMGGGIDRFTKKSYPARWETKEEITHWLKGVPAFPPDRKREERIKRRSPTLRPLGKVKITLEELEL